MPLHALEFVLDADSDARIRADWSVLVEAGLPSQARHTAPSNAPHVTIVSAVSIDPAAEKAAADVLGALLPARFDLAGFVLLGGGPFALARLLTPPGAVDDAVRDIRARVGPREPTRWLPHVTLARRLPGSRAGEALVSLGTAARPPFGVGVAGLRRWDAERRTTRVLAAVTEP